MLSALRYPYHYSNQSHGYPTQINPRDRYLAALAEAKAAEAELIAEEIRKEEELAEELALKRRLEEIHASRRYSGTPSRYHSRLGGFEFDDVSAYHRHPYGRYAHPTENRFTRLRQELEEEELRAARQRKQEHETEALIRKEMREAEIVALKRREEEKRLALMRHQREQEEKRLLELRRAQKAAEAQRSTVTPPNK
ncbi:hypothetical protein MPER_08055, partial [Moniliophthora perniciosa FA553]